MVKVEWTQEAVGDLEKLDSQVARRVVRKIGWFADNFEKMMPEPLRGEFKGLYKVRIGDWREVYTIKSDTMTIRFIGHRRDLYER